MPLNSNVKRLVWVDSGHSTKGGFRPIAVIQPRNCIKIASVLSILYYTDRETPNYLVYKKKKSCQIKHPPFYYMDAAVRIITVMPPNNMKKYRCFLIVVAILLHIPYAIADGVKLSATFEKCIAKAGAVDPAVLECIGNESEVQDRQLNLSYKALMAKLDVPRKKQLQDAQRLWLKYVEANCDFYYDPNGGTSARMMSAQCFVDARAQRAEELRDLAELN